MEAREVHAGVTQQNDGGNETNGKGNLVEAGTVLRRRRDGSA